MVEVADARSASPRTERSAKSLSAPIQSQCPTPNGLLTRMEVNKLVNRYIGVSGGYLGDFSYRTHYEFYLDLDLDIDPNNYDGTTRERFIKILTESPPDIQARILQGILDRFPAGSSDLRTQERRDEIAGWLVRLRT
jgi:hypothetical protein